MELNMLFAERLKSTRLNRGYTLGRLAELSGIHEKALFKYERGAILPSADNLRKLATALGVSADFFLFEHAKEGGIPAVKDSTLHDRYLVLENLDEGERQAALVLLDSLIARQRLRELAATTTLGTQSGKSLVSN